MFSRSITLFKLFGFPVKVDLTWIVIAVLVTWSLASAFFPHYYPDLSSGTYLFMSIVGALGLFLSIIIHEFAHSKVAQLRGLPMKGITLFIFGGVAEMTDEPPDAKTEFQMAIAGPLTSIAIAAVCFGMQQLAKFAGWPTAVVGIFFYLWLINLILVAFNIIPAYPLDGGRVLRSILWKTKGSLRSATRISSSIGAGFGIVLMVLGGISFITGSFIAGMWWFVIGMFLRGSAQASYRQLLVRRALEGENIERFMSRDPVTVTPGMTIDDFVNNYVYKHHHKLYPVVEDGKLVGCLTTKQVKEVDRKDWGNKRVSDLAGRCSSENSIGAGVDAIKALTRMRKNDISRLMVTDGGRLVGVITLKDLLDFLSLKIELEEE